MQPSNSRPLAPAPAPALSPVPAPAPASPSTSLSRQSPGSASPLPPLPGHATGIKRASTACQSCKQIKRKCDQAWPCSNCRRSNATCIYNEEEDGRRKAARKRTVETLEMKRDALDSILDHFRNSDDAFAQIMISMIRSNASLDELVSFASKKSTSQKRQLGNSSAGSPTPARKTVLSVNALCDTPLVKVPAQPWTLVTTDDGFVSHLVSIYFTWYHFAYPVLDKDAFLQDMSSGDLSSRHCSPLLVNSILATACHFSDHPRACRIPSDANTRGQHFWDEAVRLWNAEEGQVSIQSVQAASHIALSATLAGKDRTSWFYIEAMNEMLRTLAERRIQIKDTTLLQEEVRTASLVTWTAFFMTLGYGIAFLKPYHVAVPQIERPLTWRLLESDSLWMPYPRESPQVMVALDLLYEAYCDVHLIGVEVQQLFLRDEPTPLSQEHVDRLDRAMLDWRQNLSENLLIGPESATVKPPIMDLHLTYFWFRVVLFSGVKKSFGKAQGESKQSELLTYACEQTRQSAFEIAALYRLFDRDYGLKLPSIWMPHTAVTAAYNLVDDLSTPELQEIFHDLCVVLTAASRHWLVMKGHVRMLFLTAEQRGQELPARTKELLRFIALDSWGAKDHLQFLNSMYPNYTLANEDDPQLTAMGDLLERWSNLALKEGGSDVDSTGPNGSEHGHSNL